MSILDNLDTNSAISFFITVDFPETREGETLDDEDDDGDYGDDDADDNGNHNPLSSFSLSSWSVWVWLWQVPLSWDMCRWTLDDEDDDGDYGNDDVVDNGDHNPHHLFDYHHGLYEYDYGKYHCH